MIISIVTIINDLLRLMINCNANDKHLDKKMYIHCSNDNVIKNVDCAIDTIQIMSEVLLI